MRMILVLIPFSGKFELKVRNVFTFLGYAFEFYLYRHIDRHLKNGASKSIVHVIKHTNFQLDRVHPVGVIWKMLQLMENI